MYKRNFQILETSTTGDYIIKKGKEKKKNKIMT